MLDKATTLLKFIKMISEVIRGQPDFITATKDVEYSYHISVMDAQGIAGKFTIGVSHGKMSINPGTPADVVVKMTEHAFFSIIRGKMTLEQAYFTNEADIFSKDGNPYAHAIGIRDTFKKIETVTREKLGDI